MNDYIKLSIIIPTYYEEKLLENLLVKFDTELKQKYNFEVIVSDGGSKDNTIPIAELYADLVVVHTDAKPQTISQGRNAGAKIATGDILVFLNADCLPDNVEIFFKEIYKWANSNISDAIACKIQPFKDEKKFRDIMFYFVHNNYVKFLNLVGVGMGRGECQIIKKETFLNVNGYKDALVAGEDFDLYSRIRKNKWKIIFSKNIIINESPRRFRKYGYIKTLWYWTINALMVMWRGKSVSKIWEAIR